MLNHYMNTRTLRTAFFAVAVAMLTAVASVPAGAAKDKSLSKTELRNLIANAKTGADHERIAQYFDGEATKYEAEVKEHGELALFYQRHPSATPTKFPGSMQTFNHCDSLSKSFEQAAEKARQMAAEHRGMAKEAVK
jgi:hypothetical protein